VENSAMIYSPEGREVLRGIYREYLAIGAFHGLPMIVFAPTWRASRTRVKSAGTGVVENVNGDAVQFLREIVAEYGSYSEDVYMGGLMACANDAYRAQESLSREQALEYHLPQAMSLARSDVDFIMVATLPSCEEALGMADALGRSATPYILSFVVHPDGSLLDRTPFWQAVDKIDTSVQNPPAYYMINCVHPEHYASAVATQIRLYAPLEHRLLGLQANTSRRSPAELDCSDHVDVNEGPGEWAAMLRNISLDLPMKVIGGCCGTDARHIECLASALASDTAMAEDSVAESWQRRTY
jgi:homocysteine S-methyltransferase